METDNIKKIAFCWHWESYLAAWSESPIDGTLLLQYADGCEIKVSGAWLREVGWIEVPALVYLPISNRKCLGCRNIAYRCNLVCEECEYSEEYND
jgi:hypothetical protein